MSTIIEKLDRLSTYKEDIKSALFDMGVNASNDMSTYAQAIRSIQSPYKCNIVIKDRKLVAVTEKLVGLDLTKTNDNMAYQYSMTQAQTDNVQVNFIISHIEEYTVLGSRGYRFLIKCDGGARDGEYLSQYGEYKFNLTTTPFYWYSLINPTTANAKITVYRAYNQSYVWKTDTDTVGQKVYNNGGGATDGNIRVEFKQTNN